MAMHEHPWFQNEYGLWCGSCGEHIAAAWHLEDEAYVPPESCRTCGFPDDGEAMAEYHCGEEC
jgi:hypothetical protein